MKRLLLTGFATLTMVVGALQAQEALRRADKQFELKAYDLALNNYQQLYNADQSNETLEIRIAECYAALSNDVVAAAWYDRVEDKALLASVAVDYGKLLKRLGEYDKAKEIFALAHADQRDAAEYYSTSCDYAKRLMQDDYVEVYPAAFNTRYSDFGLTFSGPTPVFCSFDDHLSFVRPTQKGQGNRLYSAEESVLLNSARAYNLRPANKINYGLGPVAYAGEHCAYVRNHLSNGVRQVTDNDTDASIYLATVTSGGDFTQEIAFPFNGTDFATTHPYFSEDGQSLYFASNREGGYGGYDIYRSDLEEGQWTQPVNCGPSVNTPGHEVTPAVMGDKLIFASDYHMGLGGFDLFASLIDGEAYRAAENLGHGINTPADEYYPAAQEGVDRLYFTSNRLGGKGKEDIYVSERLNPEPVAPQAFVINQEPVSHAKPQQVQTVTQQETITQQQVEPASKHVKTNYTIDEVLAQQEARETVAVAALQDYPRQLPLSDKQDELAVGDYVSVDVQPILVDEDQTQEPRATVEPVVALEGRNSAASSLNQQAKPTPPEAFRIPDLTAGSTSSINVNARSVTDTEVARRVWSGEELPPVASVYFIQLAAFSKRSANVSSFEQLVKFGNIYKVYTGGATKVRLGYFSTETQAREALKRIRAQGYKDAFLTYQPLDINNLELVYSSYDYDVSSTSGTSSSDELSNDAGTDAYEPSSYMVRKKWDGNSRYKVRLASYEDPKYFDLSRADDLGRIEQWTKGGWTIFLTSGYDNLQEAEAARRKAVNKGFRDAVVVLDNDGILEPIKKN